VYPSPGHSFFFILQPGHAGAGIDFRKRLPDFLEVLIVSIALIRRTAFKHSIVFAGMFALAASGNQYLLVVAA
jgi:hypothetical protein